MIGNILLITFGNNTMWESPRHETKGRQYEDPVKFLLEAKGDIDQKRAREMLGKLLQQNLGFTAELLTGIRLYPEQIIYIKSWFENNFNLMIASRGAGKSSLVGLFAVLYGIFNPNTKILIVSQNFRSSRRILENIERIAQSDKGKLLHQCFKSPKLSRRGDIFSWEMYNGSIISCVPLSNGEGLRGLRANVLIVDEALLVPMKIIEEILQPFLVASGDILEKQKTRELEDRLIKAGKLKEEDRKVFKSTSKMILLSSASYQWEDLYKVYQKYLDKAINDTAEERAIASYSVIQIGFESLPPDLLDKAILEDIKNAPQSIVDREYRARFIESTQSYFSAKKMDECTIKNGTPAIELVGEKNAEYVLGIDPSFSSSESSDHFAMCLMKIINKGEKKIGMVVNQYAEAGGSLRDHILYLYYLLTHFNVVYIGIDASQGDNNEFINACNQSALFKSGNLELRDIEADFNKEDMVALPRQIMRSYSRTQNRIVQKQGFHATFQRHANEFLQRCIEDKAIVFANKISAVDNLGDEYSKLDLSMILDDVRGHKEFIGPGEGIYSFMDHQDYLMKLVKDECSLIEVSATTLGNHTYDLPQSLKRSRSSTRTRKDSYSALLLANWCIYLYLASQEAPKQKNTNTFKPIMV